MQNDPLILALLIGVSAYVIKLWFDDLKAAKAGAPNPRALPGATVASPRAISLAALGGFVIVALETFGESALGLSAEQSDITLLFAFYTLLAAFVEEIIFRGYLVIDGRGPGLRWLGVILASVLFAAIHPFLWEWKDGALLWHFTPKAWFSTAAVFVSSLWFYVVRFASFNPSHSLAPCFAAHLAKNVGVIAVKIMQGHFVGLY